MINDVDVILVMNDNMVVSGIKQLINIGLDHGVPIIASDNNSVAQGALAAIAYDQYKMGQLAGKMAVDLLNGKEAPKVSTLDKPEIYFNRSSSDKLKIKPADAVLKNASKIYEEAS
jgi:putative ABC transport system substrate-binding protein